MASYRRPLSKNELRLIRLHRMRIFCVCALAIGFVLVGMGSLLYLMYSLKPH
jgi:hypothetical protein